MQYPRIPPEKDKRIKLTDTDRDTIKSLHDKNTPIREIARLYPFVSRRLIQFILFPQRLLKSRQDAIARGQSAATYNRVKGDQWNAIMRAHRKHKRASQPEAVRAYENARKKKHRSGICCGRHYADLYTHERSQKHIKRNVVKL